MVDLFEEESDMSIFSSAGEVSVCDDIKAFIERELLRTTNKEVIEAYQKVLRYIKGIRKAADEGMY